MLNLKPKFQRCIYNSSLVPFVQYLVTETPLIQQAEYIAYLQLPC